MVYSRVTMKKLKIILEWLPRLVDVVFKAIDEGATDAEIRKRIAEPDVILTADLQKLRAARKDIDDFITNG